MIPDLADVRPQDEQNVLDLGCGRKKLPGATGVDKVDGPEVDAVVDLEEERLPFEDGRFDVVYSSHVLGHIDNIVHVFNEVHRVLKEGGEFYVHVPHFSSLAVRRNPTDTHDFSYFSFDYLEPSHDYNYYFDATFTVEERIITLRSGGYRRQMYNPLYIFLNTFPGFYERRLWPFLPAGDVKVRLQKV